MKSFKGLQNTLTWSKAEMALRPTLVLAMLAASADAFAPGAPLPTLTQFRRSAISPAVSVSMKAGPTPEDEKSLTTRRVVVGGAAPAPMVRGLSALHLPLNNVISDVCVGCGRSDAVPFCRRDHGAARARVAPAAS